MEKDIDPTVIKATQSSLGKFVKRPPLTEKLLKKPPFRFLHDIVTSVLKTTGFFEGLFDEEELVSDNVKDRENKLTFLNKVITVVGMTTGTTLAVKPSKIVAGQEPDKTNELLQCLAHALEKKLSSDEAVKKIKESTKSSKHEDKRSKDLKQTKKAIEAGKLTSKSSEKLTNKKDPGARSSNRNDVEKANIHRTKKEKDKTSESPPKKSTKLASSKKPSVEKKQTENNQEQRDVTIEKKIVTSQDAIDKSESTLVIENQSKTDSLEFQLTSETSSLEKSKQNNRDNSYTIADNALNSTLSSQDLMEVEHTQTDNHEKAVQDIEIEKSTAQKAANNNINDRVIDNIDEEEREVSIINSKVEEKICPDPSVVKINEVKTVVRPASVRPSSSRPGAPRPRDKHDSMIIEAENIVVGKVNIIAESSPSEEDEDTSIVIIEQEPNNTKQIREEHEELQASLNEHGHLVQQILDSQKEYSQMSGKTEIEWQFGAQKARDAINKELEQLRFDIQALSRVANPLGKIMDHIQEDVEVMRQELNQWTKTYDETSKELFKQKAANEDSLSPLYTKVKQLGTDIEEKREKINDLKIIIYKNSHRIDKLLANGTMQ